MKTRLEALHDFQDHAWFGKVFKRMKAADIEMCEAFIGANDQLDGLEFEYKINRMFLDGAKPKNMAIIQELLTAANLVVHPPVRRPLRNNR